MKTFSGSEEKIQDSSNIFISLYLFILIFFVLLNSVSKSDLESTEEALKSIKYTFDANSNNINYAVKHSEQSISRLKLRELSLNILRDNIRDNFSKFDFKEIDTDKNDSSNLIKYEIPITSIFENQSSTERKNKLLITKKIADIINKNSGRVLKVEITVGESLFEKSDIDLLQKRVMAIYNSLQKNKVKENLFFVGIDSKISGKIIYSFHLQEYK